MSIFKYEPNEFEKSLDASLEEFVKTIEVNQVEVKGDGSDLESKNVGKRRRMSAADWDDCLKK